jgi:hypothetical protein
MQILYYRYGVVNCIGTVMVGMPTAIVEDCGFESLSCRTKDNRKMIFDAYPLSMQHEGVRSKTVWFGIMIMCPSGATCLLVDSRFSELAL